MECHCAHIGRICMRVSTTTRTSFVELDFGNAQRNFLHRDSLCANVPQQWRGERIHISHKHALYLVMKWHAQLMLCSKHTDLKRKKNNRTSCFTHRATVQFTVELPQTAGANKSMTFCGFVSFSMCNENRWIEKFWWHRPSNFSSKLVDASLPL